MSPSASSEPMWSSVVRVVATLASRNCHPIGSTWKPCHPTHRQEVGRGHMSACECATPRHECDLGPRRVARVGKSEGRFERHIDTRTRAWTCADLSDSSASRLSRGSPATCRRNQRVQVWSLMEAHAHAPAGRGVACSGRSDHRRKSLASTAALACSIECDESTRSRLTFIALAKAGRIEGR